MRHGKAGNRLSRNQGLRKATLRDMAKATLVQERICTTAAKAKEARKLIDRLITLGKRDTLAARRRAFAILCDHGLVSRLFKETSPRFKDRPGGYTRIIPFHQRAGDHARLVFLELTEKTRMIISNQKRSKAKEETPPSAGPDAQTKAAVKEPAKTQPEQGHSKVEIKGAVPHAPKPTGIRKFFQRK
ncbi:MAG: 50S ribosomal protein L17, partial [Candidatus Omnitrophica bacterium]|nr:50S ribosomal protein L17 [Candidatus Omnitrophota bacterium]